MQPRNHCSSQKGIPKMKLQASKPISPKNLQSETSSQIKNRLALSRLGILHGRLTNGPCREKESPALQQQQTGLKGKRMLDTTSRVDPASLFDDNKPRGDQCGEPFEPRTGNGGDTQR